ncbi:MAG: penicillin-binding protein [Acidobacteriota bacterium]
MIDLDRIFDRKGNFKNRLLLLIAFFFLWSTCICLRLIYIQGLKGDEYSARASFQQTGYALMHARRGEILDRNLEPLATTIDVESLAVQRDKIENFLEVSGKLSNITNIPESEVRDRLSIEKPFVYIKRDLSPAESGLLQESNIPGVIAVPEKSRIYPFGELACQLLGLVDVDENGQGGVEYRFDSMLKGNSAKLALKVDSRRRSVWREAEPDNIAGHSLVLTIDRTIQYYAEKALKKAIEEHGALDGSAIVMDPETGEILAMASYPLFDPNEPGKADLLAQRNRAILDAYEPGSTFKILTLAAVLNEGESTPDEEIDCTIGQAVCGRKVYREATYTDYGTLTFSGILVKSSNIGTIQLGKRLSEKTLYNYVKSFGFGEKSGIELPGEAIGLVRPDTQWSRLSPCGISIGQELSVTPLQLIRAVSSVVNGGYLVKPHIIKRIFTPQGNLEKETEIEKTRILKPETSRGMRKALETVILEGTGSKAQLNGWSAGGKTGTAQKFIDGSYSNRKYYASFIGFAPVENPRLITLVVINEPKSHIYGGLVAAPAFKEIMENSLLFLNEPKDIWPGMNRNLEMVSAETTPELYDQPDPAAEEFIPAPEEASIPVRQAYLGQTVPNLIGLSLREAAVTCSSMDLELSFKGSGKIIAQRPEPGTRLHRDMVCEVFFAAS